jgi:hypothetical protein
MMNLNLQMTTDRVRSAARKGANARRQNAAGPYIMEQSEGRELTAYEKRCMDGHVSYLRMLQDEIIKSENQPSKNMQVVKKNRGPNVLNPLIEAAVVEFDLAGGSMYAFCKEHFRRFEYATPSSMYAAMKRRR